MPIANCIFTSKCRENPGNVSNLVELWASKANMSPENMTINIITSQKQFGNKYEIMSNLLLPSAWSTSAISELQIGLAKALAEFFNVTLNDVHVSTSILDSGLVVEAGREVEW